MASLKKWLDRRRNPWKGVFYDAFYKWRRENGGAHLRDYPDLPVQPVVFDLGGYKGEWADVILTARPDATIHIFEPHPDFAAKLAQKYAGRANIFVHDFALGHSEGTMMLSDAANASSAVADGDKGVSAKIVAVADFFAQTPVPHIDLMKMNIEGGEYDLLPAFIDEGVMPTVDRLQVQFHLFGPQMIEMRDAIRNRLGQTHTCAWCYPFVWEEWRKT